MTVYTVPEIILITMIYACQQFQIFYSNVASSNKKVIILFSDDVVTRKNIKTNL